MVRQLRYETALWVVVGLLASGCSRTPAAVVTWDNEVTGAGAKVNDVIALEFLPAVLGVPQGAIVQRFEPARANPDLQRVKVACEHLAGLPGEFADLSASAPSARAKAARDVARLGAMLTDLAADCTVAASTGDATAFKSNKGFAAKFKAVANLEASVGAELHDGAKCPARLRKSVKTCTATSAN